MEQNPAAGGTPLPAPGNPVPAPGSTAAPTAAPESITPPAEAFPDFALADPPTGEEETVGDLEDSEVLPDWGARPPAPGLFPGLTVHYVPSRGVCMDAVVGAPRSDSRVNLDTPAQDGGIVPVLAAYDPDRAPGTWHAATDDHTAPDSSVEAPTP